MKSGLKIIGLEFLYLLIRAAAAAAGVHVIQVAVADDLCSVMLPFAMI